MDVRETVLVKLRTIVSDFIDKKITPELSVSENLTHGDFTSNIALKLATKLNKNPRDVAEKIKLGIEKSPPDGEAGKILDRVEVAGPGFINFYLSQNYLFENLSLIELEKEKYSYSNILKNIRTCVEFGDPNPFKEIHIGHLRNFFIGESFARLLENQGADVVRVNYQGDVGLHVAKCLYGILQNQKSKIKNQSLTAMDLADAYVYGAIEFESNENAKKEIQEINKKIYEKDESLKSLWEEEKKVSLESFEKIYSRIGVKYDKYYFESDTAKRGSDIVLENIANGIFERDSGAVIYRGEKDGLHTRVFLTSEDYATYEGKDLALAVMKDEDLHYDKSIILTGNEQTEYFQVMLAALDKISPDLVKKTTHLAFGHVRLKSGKMSSRTGEVITGEWLINEAVERVKKAFGEMDLDTAEKVGIGAVRYSMLKFSINSDIHFSFDESISLEGNSGPYIQYSFVRTQSVIEKSKIKNQKSKIQIKNEKLEREEEELLRFLVQFGYVVEVAAKEFAPNLICNYLYDLSQKFNLFYQKYRVIGSEKEELRLNLTKATGQILKNGLYLLGIETVERM